MPLPNLGGGDEAARLLKVITGSAAATWPLLARAQQGERARHIGVLMNVSENDLNGQARFAAFLQAMQKLGWSDGRNLRIDARWGGNDAKDRKNAAELVALAPEIIVASGSATMGPLIRISRTPQLRVLPLAPALVRRSKTLTGFSSQ